MNLKRLTYFGVILIILLINVATGATGNTTVSSALTDAIAEATAKVNSAVAGTGVGQYPQSAIDALNDAIDDAEKVADDTSSTQPQIDAALAALNEAIEDFDAAKIAGADKTALTAAIKTANTKLKAAVAGTGVGQYPQSAIDTFKTAISAAQKVVDNKSAKQTDVDQAVTTLKAAQKKFDAAKITTVDKTALTTAIEDASEKADSAVAGTGMGQYPQAAINALNAAIDAAQEIAEDSAATEDEVAKAVTDLKAAVTTFDAAKITTVDKTALTAAIEEASEKADASVAGTGVGQYPQAAIDTFNAAIDTAQEVADDSTATESEVAKAVTNLKAAVIAFDAAKISTVDKTALTAAIEEANEKAESAVAGTGMGQYPQAAIDALNAAIDAAQEIAEDATATEDEVAQAVTNLKAAENTFDAVKITTVDIILSYVTKLEETATGSDWINWNWVNPTEEDFSHVQIYMNGAFVADTSADPSVHSYNATGLSNAAAYTISIRTVDVAGNISSTWVNDSATTGQLPTIYNLHGTDITNSSITLAWEASSDTFRVQISRDGSILGNVSGLTTYVDGNLSTGTTYSYTLIPYDESGLAGNSVSVSLSTSSGSSGGSSGGGSSRSGGSSGGGGGGGIDINAENFTNIIVRDLYMEYLTANANVTYNFTKTKTNKTNMLSVDFYTKTDILSLSFYSLKNSGNITSTLEVLKKRSKMANSTPEGLVYEYINIWVGKVGFATPANIKDSSVRFKVKNSWIQDKGIDPNDIRLQRYNGTAWEVLPTKIITETTKDVIFESQVPGFSHFAITAEKALASPINTEKVKEVTKEAVVTTQQVVKEKKNTIWTFVIAIAAVEVLSIGFEYYRRKR